MSSFGSTLLRICLAVLLVAFSTGADAVGLTGRWKNTSNGNDVYIWIGPRCLIDCIAVVEVNPSNQAVVEAWSASFYSDPASTGYYEGQSLSDPNKVLRLFVNAPGNSVPAQLSGVTQRAELPATSWNLDWRQSAYYDESSFGKRYLDLSGIYDEFVEVDGQRRYRGSHPNAIWQHHSYFAILGLWDAVANDVKQVQMEVIASPRSGDMTYYGDPPFFHFTGRANRVSGTLKQGGSVRAFYLNSDSMPSIVEPFTYSVPQQYPEQFAAWVNRYRPCLRTCMLGTRKHYLYDEETGVYPETTAIKAMVTTNFER